MNAVERTTKKVLNSILGMIIFLVAQAAFYLPTEVEMIPEVQQYLPYARWITGGFLIIAFLVLFCSRVRVFRDNWYLFASVVFIGILIYSTYINETDMEGALGSKALAAVFLLLNLAVFFSVNPKKFMLIAFFLFLAINIVNTYTVFKYFGIGMWEEWHVYRNEFYSLVGNYNGGVEFVLPMAICGSAYAHRFGAWIEFLNYPAMAMSVIMAIKCNSLTQIVVFCVILAFMIVGDICIASKRFARFIRLLLNPIVLIGVDIAAYVAIIWMNITDPVSKLGFDPGFHGRRHIWDMAIDWIHQKPVWGNGLETVVDKSQKIYGYAHCHSWFLEITYMTGIIGTAAALIMIIIVIVQLCRTKNNRLSFILSGMYFAVCLTNLFETYTVTFFVLSLGLIYYLAKNENTEYIRRK